MNDKLDYIAIPKSIGRLRRDRYRRAIAELQKREVDEIVIMRGKNSEEDILYLGKIVHEGDRIGIVTFPLHYKEYLNIIKKAQKERKFPKGIKTENLAVKQTPRRFIYGILGLAEEKLNKKVKFLEKKNTLGEKIKYFIQGVLAG
ncbi:MAG TPA: hypothetical protein VMC07_01850 [Candidatus Omnitrophota bacterium]|nr:hypothetical protein [Candidatus Omnitrophota bacterium]